MIANEYITQRDIPSSLASNPREAYKYMCMKNYNFEEDKLEVDSNGIFSNKIIEFGYKCWRKGWWEGYHYSVIF